jgi:biopolymer transport protein ExbD
LVFFCLLFTIGLFVRAVDTSGQSHGRGVDLPILHSANSTPSALRPNAMCVAVSRNGDIFVGPSKVALDDVADRLRALSQPGVERRVYLKIDRRATYADVSIALDSIRAAGICHITFLTDPSGRT